MDFPYLKGYRRDTGDEYRYPLLFSLKHRLKRFLRDLCLTSIRIRLIGLLAGKDIGLLVNARLAWGGEKEFMVHGTNRVKCLYIARSIFDGNAESSAMVEF